MLNFWHSVEGMRPLTKRILARYLRRELLRRNQWLHKELRAIDDETLLQQFFMQGFVERQRIADEALKLRLRAANSIAVGGEIVGFKTGTHVA
jgi:hypothetical protein